MSEMGDHQTGMIWSEDDLKSRTQTDRRKQKIFYGIGGMLLLLLFCPWLLGARSPKDIQARVLFMGDSIMGQCRDETSIPWLVAEQMGVPVINGDFGGTTMSLQNREGRDAYYWDGLSFSRLAKAAAARDFGGQQTIRTKNYVTMHFGDIVDELDRVDFSTVGTLVVCYGMNDYTTGSPIRNPDDPEDAYTLEGAMRTGIRHLRQRYPNLRIVFASPTYCWWFTDREGSVVDFCENHDFGGGHLEEYVEAQRGVARECGVEFLDLYHGFYPNEKLEDWRMYTEDGIHPNEAGRRKIAETLVEYLQN